MARQHKPTHSLQRSSSQPDRLLEGEMLRRPIQCPQSRSSPAVCSCAISHTTIDSCESCLFWQATAEAIDDRAGRPMSLFIYFPFLSWFSCHLFTASFAWPDSVNNITCLRPPIGPLPGSGDDGDTGQPWKISLLSSMTTSRSRITTDATRMTKGSGENSCDLTVPCL
jgi:hypothetical protein